MLRPLTLAAVLIVGIFVGKQEIAQAQPAQTANTVGDTTSFSSSFVAADLKTAPLPDAPSAKTAPAKSIPLSAKGTAFPARGERGRSYMVDLLGPGAFFAAIFQSGVDQAQSLKTGYPGDGYLAAGQHPAHGAVPEWGEGFNGYTKRYASRFGMGLVGTTSRYGLGEVLREDVTYHPCQCSGVFPRAYHALTQSMVARTRGGKSVPSLPALASPFIAAEVATAAWYPARYTVSDALRTSAPLYYGLAIKNLVKEFEGR